MTIELWDIDMPYTLGIDTNADGVDFVRISPNSLQKDRVDDYDVCLSKDQCKELARCLIFMAKELE